MGNSLSRRRETPNPYEKQHSQDAFGETPEEKRWRMIRGRKQMCGVIAHLVRGDFNERGQVNSSDVEAFLEKYPTRESAEKDLNAFAELVEKQNGPIKRAEYEVAIADLQTLLYGEESANSDRVLEGEIETTKQGPNQSVEDHLRSPWDWEDLYARLEGLRGGGIQSSKFYPTKDLINKVKKLRELVSKIPDAKKTLLQELPRQLRPVVEEMLEREAGQ